MQPKAVLSIMGRFVGIAALSVSPLAARAAEPQTSPQSTSSVHHVSGGSQAAESKHERAERTDKGKRSKHSKLKRGTRHAAPRETTDEEKESDAPAPAVRTERVSSKTPPKPSTTPLPTLAAVTQAPLVEPIDTKPSMEIESAVHAVEPRRTPLVHVSTRTDAKDEMEEAPADSASPGAARSAPVEHPRHAKKAKGPCLHAPIEVLRGSEAETFPLTKCDGSVAPLAVEELSILVRPGNATKPAAPLAAVAKTSKGDELAPGIKRVDARLVERIEQVVDHFAKPGATPKLFVVSGYRPSSKGSFHAMGRAIDFRLEGVENTDLVAFCKTLPDTGCGLYPNSSFIHLDVRDEGAGHVSWIDASSS
ncbi:MAG TPA: DUF882 domain-containing protein, partial [Polyangiaceae bacterium]